MLTGNQKTRLDCMTLRMRALQFLSTSLIASQFQKAQYPKRFYFLFESSYVNTSQSDSYLPKRFLMWVEKLIWGFTVADQRSY